MHTLALACLALSLLASLAFATSPTLPANWNYIALALLSALMVLALAYMASYVFSMPQLRAIVQDEVFQVIATGAVAILLVGFAVMVDDYLSVIAIGAGVTDYGPSPDMMTVANGILGGLIGSTVGTDSSTPTTIVGGLSSAIQFTSNQGSKSGFCNFLGIGYVLGNCAAYNSFAGALTTPLIVAYLSLADLYAQMFLLSLAQAYGFTLLIPLGLFLRCFKFTRGAGGALIAIGFGFATVYPTVIVAMNYALVTSHSPQLGNLSGPGAPECDQTASDVGVVLGTFEAYEANLVNFSTVETTAYILLVEVIFMSILNMIITLGFIRMLAHAIGSDIDVSALARIS